MQPYQVKSGPLSGTSGTEIRKRAEVIMRVERARTKRQPYTRSAYFNSSKILLHRFAGITPAGQAFFVQVRENKKTDRKDFMSVFPEA